MQTFRRSYYISPGKLNPDALICANDYTAFGAHEYLKTLGLRVPEDVVLTGFDNDHDSQFANPPLTTIELRPSCCNSRYPITLPIAERWVRASIPASLRGFSRSAAHRSSFIGSGETATSRPARFSLVAERQSSSP